MELEYYLINTFFESDKYVQKFWVKGKGWNSMPFGETLSLMEARTLLKEWGGSLTNGVSLKKNPTSTNLFLLNKLGAKWEVVI